MLVDTHCHLGDAAFGPDRPAVVGRAAAAGVDHIVVIADSLPGTRQAIAVAGAHGLSATAGVHPHEAVTWSPDVAQQVATLLDDPTIVAVGETGLDYHYDHSPRAAQRAAFEAQLQLAADESKPVVVHAREADDDLAAILRAYAGTIPTVVLHSFSSGMVLFEVGMELGAYFGWSGMVTFKNWKLRDLVAACPADRLLLETDAPYLAPVPHRGKRNEPAYVRQIAERIAAIRGVTVDALAEMTTTNAARCFGNRVRTPQPSRS